MSDTQLLAISPLDGRYANKVDGLREFVSEYGLIRYRLAVEVSWLRVLLGSGHFDLELPAALDQRLSQLTTQFSAADAGAVKRIEKTTNHDVKACEYYLAELVGQHGGDASLVALLHFGCTSEDINNLAYGLMLKSAREQVLLPALAGITDRLADYAAQWAGIPMLARTHGQTASPTTLGKEFANVLARLDGQIDAWRHCAILGKFNGAVGNYNAHFSAIGNADWPRLSRQLVEQLGLEYNPMTTQIEPHDWIAAYLHAISRICTILIDFSRDCWSYISSGYFRQKTIAGEVGSSTMPHKVNPIDFENAEGNLGIAVALAGHLADKLPRSRLQRDLTDSTVLRNLGSVLGYVQIALASLAKGLDKLEVVPSALAADLDASWEVLAEPIQTVMRRHGIADAYDQLKALTRGQAISEDRIGEILEALSLPEAARRDLAALSPASYTGHAEALTREYLSQRKT